MRRAHSMGVAVAAGLALALSACGDGGGGGDLEQADTIEAPQPDAGVANDVAEPPEAPPGRAVHRLTIEQLYRSIPVVTGGIAWVEDFGEGETDILQVLAGTLGVPDYLLVVEENMEPSLIIAKFMADAAHRVCGKWIERDRQRGPGERTLIVHEAWDSLDEGDVKASLRALQLRFFSRWVDPTDDAPIAALHDLFVAASSAAPTARRADDGWYAVCIAMMTDPAFVLY